MIAIDARDMTSQIRKDAALLLLALNDDALQVDIFVPTNSAGGPYAYYQHSVQEGRGIATRKQARRGWKFIERAIDDNVAKTTMHIENGLTNVIKHMGKGGYMRRAMDAIGRVIKRESMDNCKISPSKDQYLRTLKTKKGKEKSKFDATPGGLRDSITYKVS